jgi:putative transposase
MMGFEDRTTPVHNPDPDGIPESFIKAFKRDYFHINPLHDARTLMEQLPKWFEDYNTCHPHKALKMKSLRE